MMEFDDLLAFGDAPAMRQRLLDKGRAGVLLLAILLLAVLGCEGSSEAPTGYDVLEENGRQMVVNYSPELPPGSWILSEIPRLEIGRSDGDEPYLFGRIAHAHTLPGGEIVVVDTGMNEIRVFSPQGVYLRSHGRAGQGPGEFQQVVGVHLIAGDTLVLTEFGGRYLFFEEDGIPVRTWRPRTAPGPSHPLGGERFLWTAPRRPGTYGRGGAPTGRVVVLGTSETPGQDTVALLVGGESFPVSGEAGTTYVSVPFAEETLLLADRFGRIITSGEGYELWVRDLDASEMLQVRTNRVPVSVTQRDWDAARDAEAEAVSRSLLPGLPADLAEAVRTERVRAIDEAFSRMDRPPHMPAFDELTVDPGQRIWARRYVAPGQWPEETEWWVIGRDGRWITEVAVPGDLEVLEIGERHVVGRWVDELGVERVRVHELQKGDAGELPVRLPHPLPREPNLGAKAFGGSRTFPAGTG